MNAKDLRDSLRKSLPGRAVLTAASWAYAAGALAFRSLYRSGILRSRKLGARTICIGNLTTGGTGKTSAVLLAAQTLRKREFRVAILSRGYKRPKPTRDVVVLLGSNHPSWQEAGDEPWMMHHALRELDVPILVCPDRVRAGETAVRYYDPQVLLLDDGLQHHRLRRDLDIVLVSALDPWGGGLLPLGDLREPVSGLTRAGLVVITHSDQVPKSRVEEIRGEIAAIHPDAPVVEAVHRPCFVFDLTLEKRHRLTHLKDRTVAAFCALGNPRAFFDQLETVGAKVAQRWEFADHHAYTLQDLAAIENVRAGRTLVTTFKDFARFPVGWQKVLPGEVLALGVRMEVVKGKAAWEAELCGS